MKKRFIAATMSIIMAVGLLPISPIVDTAEAVSEAEPLIADGAEYVEGEVIVLYKDGSVTTETSGARDASDIPEVSDEFGSSMQDLTSSSTEKNVIKKELKNTLSEQGDILDESLGNAYVIEDTLVYDFEADDSTDASVQEKASGSDTSGETIVSVISSDKYTTEEMLEELSNNDAVEIAEPNYIAHTESVTDELDDEYADYEYHLNDTNIGNVLNTYSASDDEGETVVAVVDSGVDYTHEDLAGMMWENPLPDSVLMGDCGYDFGDCDPDPMDREDQGGHGTHCAGIIAAQANTLGVAGVAGQCPNVKIMALRVADEDGRYNDYYTMQAMYYLERAVENGVNVRAVNYSIGGMYENSIMDRLISGVMEECGIVFCVAAGNDSLDINFQDYSPAGIDSDCALTVASLSESGELASYSNYGNVEVDVAAPGTNIVSSVCFDNYLPYVYDKSRLEATTLFYGEILGVEAVSGSSVTLSSSDTGAQLNSFGDGVIKSTDDDAQMSLSLV
ncbi:MAG: S8 family serine peptidase, partial [Eubacterium sp.]|nr:S8 family serine peptidase [Eubacterium sp.]